MFLKEVKNFDLPDKDIKDVVTMISKWTGKNFIIDSSKIRGKITIMGPIFKIIYHYDPITITTQRFLLI